MPDWGDFLKMAATVGLGGAGAAEGYAQGLRMKREKEDREREGIIGTASSLLRDLLTSDDPTHTGKSLT
jgi:hypothetical protein